MKTRITIFIFLISIFTVGDVFAGKSDRQRTDNVLDYSLRSLRESVSEVRAKNQWLKDEINRLKHENTRITKHMQTLDIEHKDISKQTGQVKDLIQIEFEQVHILDQDRERFITEHAVLKDQYLQWEAKKRIKLKEVGAVEDEVDQLRAEVTSLSRKAGRTQSRSEDRLSMDYQRLEQQLDDVNQRLLKRERYYKKVKQRQLKEDRSAALKLKKNQVLQQIAIVKDQLTIANVKREKLAKEFKSLDMNQEGYLELLSEQIQDLSSKKQEMSATLGSVKEKIDSRNLDLAQVSSVENSMRQNLEFMKSENVSLKEDLKVLEESLKSLSQDN